MDGFQGQRWLALVSYGADSNLLVAWSGDGDKCRDLVLCWPEVGIGDRGESSVVVAWVGVGHAHTRVMLVGADLVLLGRSMVNLNVGDVGLVAIGFGCG